MDSTKPIKLNLAEKFADKEYFDAFFSERASDDIASKIKELRELQELSQIKFAELCEMKQSAVSRIESAEYSGWNFKTLLRVASALDARLAITLIPRAEVIAEYQRKELEDTHMKVVELPTGVAMPSTSSNFVTLPSDEATFHAVEIGTK
ncbi:MAG: helix-turn-helix transcriptional regulator [Betaproteobacteria bacterium]